MIWNFNSFALVFVLTAGGPGGKTMLPMLFAYNEAFKYNHSGLAAAMGNVMVIVIAVFLLLYLRGAGAQPERPMIATRSSKFTRPLQYLALIGFMIFLAFPLIFLIVTAFKTQREVPPPTRPAAEGAASGRTSATRSRELGLSRSARNSLMVALATVVLRDPAGDAGGLRARPLPHPPARGRDRLDPAQPGVPVHPHRDPAVHRAAQPAPHRHAVGLVLVYTVWSLPFALWMLQGYIAGIPNELEEAASMDGAGAAADPAQHPAAAARTGARRHQPVHVHLGMERVLLRPRAHPGPGQ